MKYLIDVNVTVSLLWGKHIHNKAAVEWVKGKELAVCPITEIGFLRVSSSPALNASLDEARETLRIFLDEHNPEFIPDDIRGLDGGKAPSSKKTTDWYLANLADKHGYKLATFDGDIQHPAVELISTSKDSSGQTPPDRRFLAK